MKSLFFIAISVLFMGKAQGADFLRDADEGPPSNHNGEEETYFEYFKDSACRLRPLEGIPFPEGRFEVNKGTDQRGISTEGLPYAFLRPRIIISQEQLVEHVGRNIWQKRSTPMEKATAFASNDGKLVRLTLDKATQLWGKPRHHTNYYSFDARNFHHGEENIFHIDLSFDAQGFVQSYRVRGIEISGPRWVVQKYENELEWDCFLSTDPLPNIPRTPGNFEDQLGQTRNAIICGDNKTVLDLCIRNGKGWVELNQDVYGKSDNIHPNWFESECVKEISANPNSDFHNYTKPTFNDLNAWWGTPRNSKNKFYTFDIACERGGESDLFHLDVRCDEKFNVIDSRLRGPGIIQAQWQKTVISESSANTNP
jgi:hypothetical protein